MAVAAERAALQSKHRLLCLHVECCLHSTPLSQATVKPAACRAGGQHLLQTLTYSSSSSSSSTRSCTLLVRVGACFPVSLTPCLPLIGLPVHSKRMGWGVVIRVRWNTSRGKQQQQQQQVSREQQLPQQQSSPKEGRDRERDRGKQRSLNHVSSQRAVESATRASTGT